MQYDWLDIDCMRAERRAPISYFWGFGGNLRFDHNSRIALIRSEKVPLRGLSGLNLYIDVFTEDCFQSSANAIIFSTATLRVDSFPQ